MFERAFIVLVIIIIALVGLKACATSVESLGNRVITEQYDYLREPTAPVDAFTEYRAALLASEKSSSGIMFYVLFALMVFVVFAGSLFVFANGFERIAKQSKSLQKTFKPTKQLQPVQRVPQLTASNSWLDNDD